MRSITRRATLLAVATLALSISSCESNGGETLPETGATVEGTIKYGDEPVQFAMIMVSDGKTAANGKVGPDGRYKVQNAPLGAVKVSVNTAAAQGDYTSAMLANGAYKGPEAKGKGRTSVKYVLLPPKYFDPVTSGLTTEVKVGQNTYDIVITKSSR